MHTLELGEVLTKLFSELVEGTPPRGGAFILNTGDLGLLRSLEKVGASDASRAVNGGATIAAHVQHVRYGLSLMNRWAREGADAFANPLWDEAWKISRVDESQWTEIRTGLAGEAHRWMATLAAPRQVSGIELAGLIASIAHLAYHLGAIRQINRDARGPKEGNY